MNIFFWNDKIPKEDINYSCKAAINIDSVTNMAKKNSPHMYLENCKYKKSWPKFADVELDLDDSDNFDSE